MSKPAPWIDRGLNLSEPDITTTQEWEAFREADRKFRGFPLPTYELLTAAGRPDVVKRWFAQIHNFTTEGSVPPTGIYFLHLYAITGFLDGVIYEIRYGGQTREANIDALALAFLHSPSDGLYRVAQQAQQYLLQDYQAPANAFPWPEHWSTDRAVLQSGLDFSTPEMQPGELEKLEAWYERVTGEIPGHVRLLGRHRPNLLKTYRARFEHTLTVLPTQAMPMLLLHYETFRGHEPGIRNAVLLARGLGMTQTETFDSVAWAMLYGAHGAMDNVERAAGDIFESW